MLLPRKQVVPVNQRQTHLGINHCLCIQSVDPCIPTGHEQWQDTREETGAGRGKGHSECQTGRFEERIQHAGNINCTVNLSWRNCCSYKKAISCYFSDYLQNPALVCSCFLHFEASLNHFRHTISHRQLLIFSPQTILGLGSKRGDLVALMFLSGGKKRKKKKTIGKVTSLNILTTVCIDVALKHTCKLVPVADFCFCILLLKSPPALVFSPNLTHCKV